MAQTPATYRQEGEDLDYTPSSAVTAGNVIVVAGRVYVAKHDIPANTLGSLSAVGVFRFPKDSSVFLEGDAAYWNPTGNPVGGTAGSGAMSTSSAGATFAGYVILGGGQLTGGTYVDVKLSPYASGVGGMTVATVAAAGSVQGDATLLGQGFTLVSAADGTKGVRLPPAVAGAHATIKNNANAVLKVYPATGDAINAIAANSPISMAAFTSASFDAYDSTTWYTTPLVPS